MGIDDASYFLECLVRIWNIAYPNATSRYISKPESSKHISAGRGVGRQCRKIDAAKPIYSLEDVFAQCDFFHIPELDDLLVDCKKSLFKFEPVGRSGHSLASYRHTSPPGCQKTQVLQTIQMVSVNLLERCQPL